MKKDLEKKAKQILAGLTSEQKCRILCGQGAWHTDDLNGKLPQIFMSDGPVGLRTVQVREDGKEETWHSLPYRSLQTRGIRNEQKRWEQSLRMSVLTGASISCWLPV